MKPFSTRISVEWLFSFFDESRKKETQQRKYGDYNNNLTKTTHSLGGMDNKEQVSLIQHWESGKRPK